MNKNEIKKKIKLENERNKKKFLEFIKIEKFDIGVDKIGNFIKDTPIYYKRISKNKFIVFIIPFYGKVKNARFETDFFEITAVSENEFIDNILLKENIKHILLGFNLLTDIELYKNQIIIK